jgi:hypothetical protein
MRRRGSLPGRVATQTAAFIAGGRADHLRIGDPQPPILPWTGRNFSSLPDSQLAGNRRGAAEFFRSRRRTMVMRKVPSPKQKKVIVKHMVKDAKKLRSAYAKGKKKKFQAAFGRLSAAMIDVDPKGGT